VVAKAEYLEKGENPRFLVTSLAAESWPAQGLYEKLFCARDDMENRIKEQLSLFSDRMSTETLRANQLRLYFSSLASRPDACPTPLGSGRHGMGASPGSYAAPALVEDRCGSASERPPYLGALLQGVSLETYFHHGLDDSTLLNFIAALP
jgi:Transposase DDE domain group 1